MAWELYLQPSYSFIGESFVRRNEALFWVFGVPYDSTASYRPGARQGPQSVRYASQNIETYSPRSGVDVEDVLITDIGDVSVVHGDPGTTLKRVGLVVEGIVKESKIPIMIGGEHSITFAATLKAVKKEKDEGFAEGDFMVVVFDAHADLREAYLGERFSHASVSRRIVEEVGPENLLQIGVRAISKEEKQFVSKNKVVQITALEVLKDGLKHVLRRITDLTSTVEKVYVSVDMDVFDPAFAPGVGNPEPEGLSPTNVFDIIWGLEPKICGIDVMELCPPFDFNGITAVLAAKTLFELIAKAYTQNPIKAKREKNKLYKNKKRRV